MLGKQGCEAAGAHEHDEEACSSTLTSDTSAKKVLAQLSVILCLGSSAQLAQAKFGSMKGPAACCTEAISFAARLL